MRAAFHASMTRIPETHQALNKAKIDEMKNFLLPKLDASSKDKPWVDSIWAFFKGYPLKDEIAQRLDIVWHHVFNEGLSQSDLSVALSFVEHLEDYIKSQKPGEVFKEKLTLYQDELNKQLNFAKAQVKQKK